MVDLVVNLVLNDGDPDEVDDFLNYVFTLEETPNNPNDNPGDVCPYPTPAGEGCTDRVTVDSSPPAEQTFFINGQEYTLEILGFVPGVSGACEYDPDSTVVEFITQEDFQNDACLFARIIEVNRDWGDAPDTYATLDASSGPNHIIVSNLAIGIEIDSEADGQPNTTATGDDTNGSPDDEDGLVGPFAQPDPGQAYPVDVTVTNGTGDAAFLCGWIDWPTDGTAPAGDGQFDESERVCVDTGDAAACSPEGGDQFTCTLPFTAPGTLGAGQTIDTFLRLRLGSELDEVDVPTGEAWNGEVEDHNLIVNTVPVTIGYFSATASGDSVNFTWQTATETANAGFNLYAETDGGLVKLNDSLIQSTVIDSVEPTDYSYSAATSATSFYIEDVGLDGKTGQAGPVCPGRGIWRLRLDR